MMTHKLLQTLSLILLCSFTLHCESWADFKNQLEVIEQHHPFAHQLDVRFSKGTSGKTLLCSHDFGKNSRSILERVRPYTADNLIAFNYIDHDFTHSTGDDTKTVIATPLEIMPLLYMMKQCVVDNQMSSLSLYGYSLGASNIIYAIHFLISDERDALLKQYGIDPSDKKKILNALRKGVILLDSPFKSIDENIAWRGANDILLMYKERAAKHQLLSPLDTLGKLKSLQLTVVLFFDSHDESFSNMEDSRFAKNLLDANADGTSIVISADNGGHDSNHDSLWKIYSTLNH